MCCFSPAPPAGLFARLFTRKLRVADTHIFARMLAPSTQALVYAMELGVANEVAMILPLPVATGAGDDACEFVSLAEHPHFFSELASLFEAPTRDSSGGRSLVRARPKLAVHRVGAFEASFVPSQRDFDRLDPRFRLPTSVWSELGDYDDWGFAVFRLAPGKKAPLHPMAFRFPTRDASRLFFPTVHVHDGRVHDTARFDHALYYQGAHDERDQRSFFTTGDKAHFFVIPGAPVFRRTLRGRLPNRDTWIAA